MRTSEQHRAALPFDELAHGWDAYATARNRARAARVAEIAAELERGAAILEEGPGTMRRTWKIGHGPATGYAGSTVYTVAELAEHLENRESGFGFSLELAPESVAA